MNNLKERIKKELGVTKWSIRCDRLLDLVENGWDLDKLFIFRSSDKEKWERKGRKEKYRYKIIGVDGFRYKSYIFVVEPIEKKS